MTLNGAVLTNFPAPATLEDYARAADELDAALAALPGVIGVYRYGSISRPGISDLDRLVVVEDKERLPDVWSGLSGSTRHLTMHTPGLVDAQAFQRHRWFTELGKVELVWGAELTIEQRPHPEYSAPLIAAEALVVTALKLAKLSVTRRVKVRPLLCELRNVGVDLKLARLGPDDAPEAWSLVREVDSVREVWWHLGADEQSRRIRRVLALAPAAVREAIDALAGGVVAGPSPGKLHLRTPWRNVTIVPGASENRNGPVFNLLGAWRRAGEALWRWTPRMLTLPPAVVSLLAGPVPHPYHEFRVEREALVRRQADLIASSPSYSGLSFAGSFLQR